MEPPTRVFVACDVANLVRSCRRQFGDNARIDFGLLSTVVPALMHPRLVQQTLIAYVVMHERTKPANEVFRKALGHYGFRVRARDMVYAKVLKTEVKQPTNTDWDVGITIDAIHHMPEYDLFVLMSGDGDFAMLLDYLRRYGKETMVFSFDNSLSRTLHRAADKVVQLTQAVVTYKERV